MNSLPALDDVKWLALMELVKDAFDKDTLLRGFETYNKQQVQALSEISGNAGSLVRAQVNVTEEIQFEVKLGLAQNLASSTCSCPVPKLCRHIAAVMMAYADRWGYPAAQLINSGYYLSRINTEQQVERQSGQLPSINVDQWHSFLAAYTKAIPRTYSDQRYMEDLKNRLADLAEYIIALPEAERLFFQLHQSMFIMEQALRPAGGQEARLYTPYWQMNAFRGIGQWIEAQGEAINALVSAAAAGAAYSPVERLSQTIDYIRRRMEQEADFTYYNVYVAIWRHWITPGGKWQEPGVMAARELAELDKAASRTAPIQAAKAYLLLGQGLAGEAWEALQANSEMNAVPQYIYTLYLNQLCESENWEGLIAWLSGLTPYFHQPRTNLHEYISYWQIAIGHVPSAEAELWKRLEELLPRSQDAVVNMLYEQRQWKRWIEYQLLAGTSPLDYRVSVLQPIEKEAPELLLTYYHQFVDRHIAMRSRQDYKTAVKMLKRLKKLYSRLKRAGRWEQFIKYFAERYSRLRALQEEIQKGKLME